MRNVLFILLFSFPLLLSSQIIDYDHVKWDLKNKDDYKVEYTNWGEIIISDSIVSFTIRPKASKMLWDCKISNTGSDKIIVKWNEAAMGSYSVSKIVFGDMNSFDMKREIPNALIYKDSYLNKSIGGSNYIGDGYILDMVRLKDMKKDFKKQKKTQFTSVTIIIPIEYDGVEKLYKLDLRGEYAGKIKN